MRNIISRHINNIIIITECLVLSWRLHVADESTLPVSYIPRNRFSCHSDVSAQYLLLFFSHVFYPRRAHNNINNMQLVVRRLRAINSHGFQRHRGKDR